MSGFLSIVIQRNLAHVFLELLGGAFWSGAAKRDAGKKSKEKSNKQFDYPLQFAFGALQYLAW
jgi:hypothetical protein